MDVKTSRTDYLEIRTEALIQSLRRASREKIVPRKETGKTIYELAREIAREANADTKSLSADLAHRLEIEYPRLSAGIFTHNG